MKYPLTYLLLLLIFSIQAQEDSAKFRLDFNGYIKDMLTLSFVTPIDSLEVDNLVHNRLNFRSHFGEHLKLDVEIRNRVFSGSSLQDFPFYGEFFDSDPGTVDMAWNIVETDNVILNTMIDRAYGELVFDRWNIRVGRQRINWGMTYAWNANDLFNTYSFVDFDYEERPGSDAVRVQHHFKDYSTAEIAFKPTDDLNDLVAAGLYRFNKWTYDIQFLGGVYQTDAVAGLGWAGNLWKAGFKGEASYFHNYKSFADTTVEQSISIAIDYMTSGGWYLLGAFLYNSNGAGFLVTDVRTAFLLPLSPKNLMPSRYSVMLQGSRSFSPILNAALVTVYMPGLNLYLIMPSITYSIARNWDLSFYTQAFMNPNKGNLNNSAYAGFFRVRYSFSN